MLPSLTDILNESFEATVAAVADEMPLLMHGAGDVPPDQVDDAAVQLISSLTVQYIGRLVDAAIDSREMLLDHQHVFYKSRNKKKRKHANSNKTTSGRMRRPDPPLPPPTFHRSILPAIPPPPEEKEEAPSKLTTATDTNILDAYSDIRTKRKRQPNVEYWDDPLPEPKIRGRDPMNEAQPIYGDGTTPTSDDVHVDEWVGVAGVDLFQRRCRAAYVRGPAAITTQSFIFPICHDVYTYGRIREIQSAKRTTYGNLLENNVLMDIVRAEGHHIRHHRKKKKHHQHSHRKKGDYAGNTSDPEDDDDDADSAEGSDINDDQGPNWPGLDGLLPVHQNLTEFAKSMLGG